MCVASQFIYLRPPPPLSFFFFYFADKHVKINDVLKHVFHTETTVHFFHFNLALEELKIN